MASAENTARSGSPVRTERIRLLFSNADCIEILDILQIEDVYIRRFYKTLNYD